MPPLDPAAAVAAYQRLQLLKIRSLYDDLDPDLGRYLEVERGVSKEIDSLQGEFEEIRKTLSALGADLPDPEDNGASVGPTDVPPPVPALQGKRYGRVEANPSDGDFRGLVGRAEGCLAEAGLNLSRDPLLQVLGPGEAASIARSYTSKHGDTSWDSSDYLVVALAGTIATLLDIFLVRIPSDTLFLGKLQSGSPLTKWLKEKSGPVHEHFLSCFEGKAKVPYDDSIGSLVDGLSPKVHRLMSPGHDPVLGFLFGVIDVMTGTGTFIDKHGNMIRVPKPVDPESLIQAFLKVFLHLISDVFTSAGLPPPFLTLLQLVKAKSPFVLGPSGERVSWTNVARYMYTHGYDLRHFSTMGVVPATVEMTIRGWWLCRSFEDGEGTKPAKAKLTSMLLLGHTIATSGTMLKTGTIYAMNPLALNWAEILAMFPVTVAWIRESIKRERSIKVELDAEWKRMHRANLGHPA